MTRWTHSLIAASSAGYPVTTMGLTLDDHGHIVDSSAKLYGPEVATYLERLRYRWAVALADGGRAMHTVFATPLDGDVTFEALAGAPGATVIMGPA